MLSSALHRWTALGVVALLLLQGVPFAPLAEYGQAAAACDHCTVLWCLITDCACPHHERELGHHHGGADHADDSEAHDAHATPAAAHEAAAEADCPSLCGCDRTPVPSVAVSAIDKVVVRETAALSLDDRAQQAFPPFSGQVVPQRVADDIFHPPRAQG